MTGASKALRSNPTEVNANGIPKTAVRISLTATAYRPFPPQFEVAA